MSSPETQESTPPAAAPGIRRPGLLLALLGLGLWTVVALAGGAPGRVQPELQSVWWISTETGGEIAPPPVPVWLEVPGANSVQARFGAIPDGMAVAWYVVAANRPALELWAVDKSSVRLTDAGGNQREWTAGSGSVRLGERDDLQFLYVLVPADLVSQNGRLSFELVRGPSTRTGPVEVTF
ncbi:MAG: hypothetical protein FJX77_14905 [Armatimonadetes bacterium]|nr:hypothetical protein [Armatimonadota bacterium]